MTLMILMALIHIFYSWYIIVYLFSMFWSNSHSLRVLRCRISRLDTNWDISCQLARLMAKRLWLCDVFGLVTRRFGLYMLSRMGLLKIMGWGASGAIQNLLLTLDRVGGSLWYLGSKCATRIDSGGRYLLFIR